MTTLANNLFIVLTIFVVYLVLTSLFNNRKKREASETILKKAFLKDIDSCQDILECIACDMEFQRCKFMMTLEIRDNILEALNKKKIEVARVSGIRVY